jgi:hypothetical protein
VNKYKVKKRAGKSHCLEVKLEVLNWFDRSEHSIDVQRAVGLSDSILRTICDNFDTVCKSTQSTTNLSVTGVTKSQSHS